MVSGIVMIVLAPVIGFSSGSLLLHFYDWGYKVDFKFR